MGSWFGVSDHMSEDVSLFLRIDKITENLNIKIANGSIAKVEGIGRIRELEKLVVEYALYVPSLSCNMLSLNKITKHQELYSH